MTGEYRGTEGTRPYEGAGWFYAEYRDRASDEFVAMLAAVLGWTGEDRVLDLGAGPGQLSIPIAPLVGEVVAVEPEADMLAEGVRRAHAADRANVRFIEASSDDLPALRASLGTFKGVVMGASFHWMLDKDRVLADLAAMTRLDGAVAFVTAAPVSADEQMQRATDTVRAVLGTYLAGVPEAPQPRGRHDPFEVILARSAFSRVESVERRYSAVTRPTVESLVGYEYTMSHVLSRLGDRRPAFEEEVRTAVGAGLGEVVVQRRDDALIGRRA